jgi:hypothetical protein
MIAMTFSPMRPLKLIGGNAILTCDPDGPLLAPIAMQQRVRLGLPSHWSRDVARVG